MSTHCVASRNALPVTKGEVKLFAPVDYSLALVVYSLALHSSDT